MSLMWQLIKRKYRWLAKLVDAFTLSPNGVIHKSSSLLPSNMNDTIVQLESEREPSKLGVAGSSPASVN